MKILITGASGLLGERLFEILSKTYETTGTYFNNKVSDFYSLDISSKQAVESFFKKIKPDIIIHGAAISNADYCEENQDIAKMINIEGTKNIVEICKKYGCKIVFISSDYVFDGKESLYNEESQLNPVNYYGITKVEGEKIVKENLDNYIIIRPSILYGDSRENKSTFVSEVLYKLKNKEKIFADNKIIKYPILIDDVSKTIKKLIGINAHGIYHVSGDEAVTRYEWAIKIAKFFGFPTKDIIEKDSVNIARRPLNVKLDTSKIKELGINFSMVEEGLKIMKNQKGCMFKMIYSARPDMLILNQNVSSFRINVGKQLAKEHPADADMVIPIPESGIYGATGYAAESRIPFYFGLIREYYIKKTLFEPTLKMRSALLDKKIIIVPEVIKDKRIVLIDEAIFSGVTLGVTIEKLKKAGVKEIHVRIPSPPVISSCNNNILEKDAELIAKKFDNKKEDIEEELKKYFEVNSLHFLSLEGFLSSLTLGSDVCIECFKNKKNIKIIRSNEVLSEKRGKYGGYSIKRLFTEALNKNPKNLGFYETTIRPKDSVKNHYHKDLDEILYFITKGKVKVNDNIYTFNPGDIIILPPENPHEIIADEEEVRLIAIKLPNIVNDKIVLD